MPVNELKAQGKKPKSAMNCVIGGIMIIFNLDYDLQITLLIKTKNYSHQECSAFSLNSTFYFSESKWVWRRSDQLHVHMHVHEIHIRL